MNTGKPTSPPPPGLRYRLMQRLMCPLMSMMGISCRHFAQLAAEQIDRPFTRRERIALRVHCLMCHVCRPLPDQFKHLHHLVRCCGEHSEAVPEPQLSPEARTTIREALVHESRQSDNQ